MNYLMKMMFIENALLPVFIPIVFVNVSIFAQKVFGFQKSDVSTCQIVQKVVDVETAAPSYL